MKLPPPSTLLPKTRANVTSTSTREVEKKTAAAAGETASVKPVPPSVAQPGQTPGVDSFVALSKSSMTPGADSSAALKYGLPARVLPPIADALVDPSFPELAPTQIAFPDSMLKSMMAAKRILVVGHIPPDGDAVGSALGLSRALTALGKEAVACVDSDLPGNIQALDHGDLKQGTDIAGQEFDLVILVDVANVDRIGPAAAAAVAASPAVQVLDHHLVSPTAKSLGLREGASFEALVDVDAESASFLVASAVGHLEQRADAPLSPEVWASVAEACASASFTDTGGFQVPGTSADAAGLFKWLVNTKLDGDLDSLVDNLHFELAPETRELLLEQIPTEVIAANSAQLSMMTAPQEHLATSLEAAASVDSRTGLLDLTGHLQDRLDDNRGSSDVALLLVEDETGVRGSVRSRSATAASDLAEAFQGGSKPGSGGFHVPGGSISEVASDVKSWFDSWSLREHAKLRMMG